MDWSNIFDSCWEKNVRILSKEKINIMEVWIIQEHHDAWN
jgi:hypothetical protein